MGQPRWGWPASGGFTDRRLKPAATLGWPPLGPLVTAYLSAYEDSPKANNLASLRDPAFLISKTVAADSAVG